MAGGWEDALPLRVAIPQPLPQPFIIQWKIFRRPAVGEVYTMESALMPANIHVTCYSTATYGFHSYPVPGMIPRQLSVVFTFVQISTSSQTSSEFFDEFIPLIISDLRSLEACFRRVWHRNCIP
jgi:hypothetical protein